MSVLVESSKLASKLNGSGPVGCDGLFFRSEVAKMDPVASVLNHRTPSIPTSLTDTFVPRGVAYRRSPVHLIFGHVTCAEVASSIVQRVTVDMVNHKWTNRIVRYKVVHEREYVSSGISPDIRSSISASCDAPVMPSNNSSHIFVDDRETAFPGERNQANITPVYERTLLHTLALRGECDSRNTKGKPA